MTAIPTLERPTSVVDRVAKAARRRRLPAEVVALATAALLTRLVFLTSPRAIVFDEVYFRDAALHYRDGTYYFDLHPPLGKLLLSWWAEFLGVEASPSLPAGTTATAESMDPAVWVRLLPALAGAALIVVFYYFLRNLGLGRKVATLGAGLLLLDNALLVQSRFILIDSFLLLFGLGALTLFLTIDRYTGRAHWVRLAGAAALAGMAASTKLTGLTALGIMGIVWLAGALRQRSSWRQDWRRLLGQGALHGLVPVVVYLGTWAVHVAKQSESGPGNAFLSAEYQTTLTPSPAYPNPAFRPDAELSLPDRVIELNDAMKRYEHSLNDSTHPYASHWRSWPAMKRGIFYYVEAESDGKARYIYLLGNPVLWWGTLLALAATALAWLIRPERFTPHRRQFAFLGGAWALSYLPFAFIERPMFLYHYFFPLMFSLGAAALGIGILAGWTKDPDSPPWRFGTRASLGAFAAILTVAALAFAWFAPLTYGIPLTDGQLQSRMWLDTWR